MKPIKRNSFVFYDSFYKGIKDLPKEDRLMIYDTIIKYAIEGENPPPLNSIQNSIFSLIKPQIDANNKKYKNGKRGKSFGKLGGEYGKLGGRPKTPQKPPTQPPKNPPNVNVNVNVNDIDKVLDSYKEKINKNSRPIPLAKDKIRLRLKEFSLEELLTAIENFSKDEWNMTNNSFRGIAWFFDSEKRIDGFLTLDSRKTSINPFSNYKKI